MRTPLCDVIVNKNYSDIYLLKSCQVKQTRNNKDYLNVVLGDATGEISGNIWQLPAGWEKLEAGGFCKASFTVDEYQGQKQANISMINYVSPTDKFDRDGLLPVSPTPPETLYADLYNTADGFKNGELWKLTTTVLKENREELMGWPGAKGVHHAVLGGLLLHTDGMLKVAKAMCDLYPGTNKELLMAGVILHDIAKIKEFSLGVTGLVSDYSTEGKLLGHIYMGAKYIADKCAELELSDELSMVLQHMILAHHGKLEYGSPKTPMIWEANLLHQIDDMDAKSYIFAETLSKMEPGTFSDKIFALDNVQIYKPNLE